MIEEKERREFFTSIAGFKDFLEGGVWRDIKSELEDMISLADIALRNEKDPPEIYTWQGRATALEDMITMIELLGETAEEEKKEIDSEEEEEPSNEIDYTLGGEND